MLYYGQKGRTYELDRVIRSGGEGIVHSIQGNPYSVAKIYKPERIADPQLLESTRNKILAMLAMRFNPRVGGRVLVAWPEDALFDRRGVFQGFVMPKIQDMKSLIWASRPSDRAVLWPNGYRWRYSMSIAFNLARTIECLHSAGIVVGDMNTNNILINAKGMVTLIDADSFNIQPYKCIVGFPEVLPPELQGKDLRKQVNAFSEKTDCFSLAIHIFCLLCNNCHPFGCLDYNQAHGSSSSPQIQGNILKGYCPYVSASRGRTVDDALDMDVFPPYVRNLFDRAFRYDASTAVKWATIANRPSAAEWRSALGNLYSNLYQSGGVATCRFNPFHEYPKYYQKGCPWCAIEQRKRLSLPPPLSYAAIADDFFLAVAARPAVPPAPLMPPPMPAVPSAPLMPPPMPAVPPPMLMPPPMPAVPSALLMPPPMPARPPASLMPPPMPARPPALLMPPPMPAVPLMPPCAAGMTMLAADTARCQHPSRSSGSRSQGISLWARLLASYGNFISGIGHWFSKS